jgi:hypothetical protein
MTMAMTGQYRQEELLKSKTGGKSNHSHKNNGNRYLSYASCKKTSE